MNLKCGECMRSTDGGVCNTIGKQVIDHLLVQQHSAPEVFADMPVPDEPLKIDDVLAYGQMLTAAYCSPVLVDNPRLLPR